MKIGYPCINRTLSCKGNRTFRLKSYSEKRLIETVDHNLECLYTILRFNIAHKILFFRITSGLVPFASHHVCTFDWQSYFKEKFKLIGDFVSKNDVRISMHPDQYTFINSQDERVFYRAVKELMYHCELLNLMHLDSSAKIQIHVGGIYSDKQRSMERFIDRYFELDDEIVRRLVIENDDRNYTIADCMQIHYETQIPVLFDVFHHTLNAAGETVKESFSLVTDTWNAKDGVPMVDYSYQQSGKQSGKHAESIDVVHFKQFLTDTQPWDFDVMLEIKDKEISALKAVETALNDERFAYGGVAV